MAYKNKIDALAYYRKYHIAHKEEKREYKKERYQKFKEYKKEWSRKKYQANKELYKNRAKVYGVKIQARYLLLTRTAKRRGYEMLLSFEEFQKIVASDCKYCGENKKILGIDRIDNTQGYTVENSAPCCKICNMMKHRLSKNEFCSHIEKIHSYQLLTNLLTI